VDWFGDFVVECMVYVFKMEMFDVFVVICVGVV